MADFTLLTNSLDNWYHEPLGQAIFAAESEQLATVLPNLFGLHMLQLGCAGQHEWLNKSPIHHRVVLTPEKSSYHPNSLLQSKFTELPFRNDSIDVVVLPHILEFEPLVRSMLDECWRVLTADGHLVILGFNPWSLWGIKHLFKKHTVQAPWCGQFHSVGKIYRLLAQFGGEVIVNKYFFYYPPCEHKEFYKKFAWFELFNKILFPNTGAIYLLVVKKRIIPLKSIPLRWQWREIINNKGLEPTAGRLRRG